MNDTERYLVLALIEDQRSSEPAKLPRNSNRGSRIEKEQGRVLVVRERAGQLEGRFGLPGKGLEQVVLSTDLEDWLSGKMTLTGGNRSGNSPDRPVQLERKK